MDFLKLLLSFATLLVVVLFFKKPLWISAGIACIVTILIFGISFGDALSTICSSAISSSTLQLVAVIYLVAVLQYILKKHGSLTRAEIALRRLIRSRRAIIMLSPVVFGLLPAPNAVVLAAPIVESAAGDDLSNREKAFVTSYYRHIPESSLPLYTQLLLALSVTGLSAAGFLLGVLPMVAVGAATPYFMLLRRKIPPVTGEAPEVDKKEEFSALLKSLWPILALVVVVVGFELNTALCTLVLCILLLVLYRKDVTDYVDMLKSAFNLGTILSIFFLMIFKDVISSTGVVAKLPELFAVLPVPLFLIYALLMFFGGLFGVSNALIAVAFPIAFATIPNAGIPLLVLLMSFSHSAAQLSPTHLCIDITARRFNVDIKDIIVETIPVTIVYLVFSVLYYLVLTAVL